MSITDEQQLALLLEQIQQNSPLELQEIVPVSHLKDIPDRPCPSASVITTVVHPSISLSCTSDAPTSASVSDNNNKSSQIALAGFDNTERSDQEFDEEAENAIIVARKRKLQVLRGKQTKKFRRDTNHHHKPAASVGQLMMT